MSFYSDICFKIDNKVIYKSNKGLANNKRIDCNRRIHDCQMSLIYTRHSLTDLWIKTTVKETIPTRWVLYLPISWLKKSCLGLVRGLAFIVFLSIFCNKCGLAGVNNSNCFVATRMRRKHNGSAMSDKVTTAIRFGKYNSIVSIF